MLDKLLTHISVSIAGRELEQRTLLSPGKNIRTVFIIAGKVLSAEYVSWE